MGEPTFADRMKRMRETAQLLQKTETAENTVSYRSPEWRLRRSVWYISMYAMVGGGSGTVNGLGMRSGLRHWDGGLRAASAERISGHRKPHPTKTISRTSSGAGCGTTAKGSAIAMFGARHSAVLTQIVAALLAHRRDEITLKGQVPMAKQSHTEVFTLFVARVFHSLSHC
jgi:hypothetical protein